MLFTLHIGEKLDLSKFRKQVEHYIRSMRQLTYHIYLPNFRLIVDIARVDSYMTHDVKMTIQELSRDRDDEIDQSRAIDPTNDHRFQGSKFIQSLFEDQVVANFITADINKTIDNICQVVSLLYKVNSLLSFT